MTEDSLYAVQAKRRAVVWPLQWLVPRDYVVSLAWQHADGNLFEFAIRGDNLIPRAPKDDHQNSVTSYSDAKLNIQAISIRIIQLPRVLLYHLLATNCCQKANAAQKPDIET